MTTRRAFLARSSAAAAALALGVRPLGAWPAAGRPAPLKILILGGTGFIGPYQVRYALDRGHTVTLFNRGRTNPGLFPEVEKLQGDRATGDYASLANRRWDVVIDNSATNPEWVAQAAALLAPNATRYVFVSTRSVYKDTSRVPMTIDAEVFTRANTPVAEGQALPYGLAKSLAEDEARRHFPGRALVVRPSLIVGPGDLTDRFTYWPVRIERGGEVLAPGDGTDPVQVIDARDLSEWMIRLAEQGTVGTYNALGPKTGRPFRTLLETMRTVIGSDATFTWVDTDFLAAQKVRPYQEMPVWQPARGGREGFARFDITRELALGLTFRSLEDTVRDTLAYYHAQPPERQATLRAGLSAEREREVLAAWKARGTAGR